MYVWCIVRVGTCLRQLPIYLPALLRTSHPSSSLLCVCVCLQTLGTGAFGSVRLVHDKATKKLLALKSLKRRNINKYLESEIVNHSLLRLVGLTGFFCACKPRGHVVTVIAADRLSARISL